MAFVSHQPRNAFPSHFVFNHFPKAGGTSFFAVLKENVTESAISPQLMEQEIRLARPERFEHYRLIRGHFSVLTQMGFSRSRYSMTLLRDPIRTIVSTYNFWRNRIEEDPVSAQAKRMSFAEFVRRFADSPVIIHNTYTHHFAAVGRDYPGEPSDPDLLLAYAQHNLAAFNFVGICERLDDSVRLLCQNLGWPEPARAPHENQSTPAQSVESIDSETRQILLDRNQLDLQLYDYAKVLFQAHCARAQQTPLSSGGTLGTATGKRPTVNGFRGGNRFLAYPIPPGCRSEASICHVVARCADPGPANLLKITIVYETRIRLPELMVGITIFNAEGEVKFGTNTWMENAWLRQEPGATSSVTFEVECGSAPGIYSITAALGDSRRPGFHYDWVDRAAVFQVDGTTHAAARLKGCQLVRIDAFPESTINPFGPISR